jgi:hypothetical protein
MQFAKKTHKPAKNQEDTPTPVAAQGKSETEMFTDLEWLLKSTVKASQPGLYSTMAQQIIEEAPQNAKELFDCIGQHMADAPDSFNRPMKKLCTDLHKTMDAKKLIGAKKVKVVIEEIKPD